MFRYTLVPRASCAVSSSFGYYSQVLSLGSVVRCLDLLGCSANAAQTCRWLCGAPRHRFARFDLVSNAIGSHYPPNIVLMTSSRDAINSAFYYCEVKGALNEELGSSLKVRAHVHPKNARPNQISLAFLDCTSPTSIPVPNSPISLNSITTPVLYPEDYNNFARLLINPPHRPL